MRPYVLPTLLVSVALVVTACQSTENAATTVQSAAQAQTTSTLSTTDATFVNMVGMGGIAEVKFGELAQTRATRGDVRQFAAQMVTDHSAANQQLTTLAQGKGMTPPSAMDATHQALYGRLSAMTGSDFDKAYMQSQVQDHIATIQAFQNESQSGSDGDLRQFAGQTLPTLQHHLDMAKRISAQ